ncbi:HAD-IA family hydrolase [Shewanella sp. SNU WT4]|uniref:HAD-IA family hydrolase n=1 Tax=Shewanella sp. SNU WT4 TaxID=2590015 RepID=UPI00112EFA86|nr:HAD-IA family hydrolase [Shewanella sp. SNU WT4]QDF66839.1 HAD-IA family hydrolase [Shewanella sp. SNU WT4]
MRQQFDLIVFDWDGTLMDSIGKIIACVDKLACHLQLPAPSEAQTRAIIGLSLAEALATLFPQVPLSSQLLIDIFRQQFIEVDAVPTPLFVGVESLLQQLTEQGFTLAVATGKSKVGLDTALQQTGLGHYFKASRTSDECSSKPHPQMLHEIMQQLNIDAARTIMIGDSRLDMQMGKSAEVATIGVSYGAQDKCLLALEQPMAIVDSIEALAAHFRQ